MTDHVERTRILAVFKDRSSAENAVRAAEREGAPARIDDRRDEVAELRAEMREEASRSVIAPGNVGPFTKEQTAAVVGGSAIGIIVGALIAVPFALIPVPGLPLWARLIVYALIGAAAGWTVAFTISGGLSGKAEVPMATERGVTVSAEVRDDEQAERLLDVFVMLDPIRVDRTTGAGVADPVVTEEQIGRERERRHRAG